MSYRVKAYVNVNDVLVGFGSETVETHAEADAIIDNLSVRGIITGGHVETHVPGIGWVVSGEEESAMICARRREQEEDDGDTCVGEDLVKGDE